MGVHYCSIEDIRMEGVVGDYPDELILRRIEAASRFIEMNTGTYFYERPDGNYTLENGDVPVLIKEACIMYTIYTIDPYVDGIADPRKIKEKTDGHSYELSEGYKTITGLPFVDWVIALYGKRMISKFYSV